MFGNSPRTALKFALHSLSENLYLPLQTMFSNFVKFATVSSLTCSYMYAFWLYVFIKYAQHLDGLNNRKLLSRPLCWTKWMWWWILIYDLSRKKTYNHAQWFRLRVIQATLLHPCKIICIRIQSSIEQYSMMLAHVISTARDINFFALELFMFSFIYM